MEISKQKIQIEMAKLGLNLTALANLSGISRQSLSTIMGRGSCSPVNAGKIAKALSCDVTDLIDME